jgi:hypothetical protein
LFYYPGAPFDMDALLAGSFASQDFFGVVAANPIAYLRHRTCAVASLMDFPGRGLFYPYHGQLDFNTYGAHVQSLLPDLHRLVLNGFLEPVTSNRKWLVLRLPFSHWLLFVESMAAAVFCMAGRVSKRSKRTMEWSILPACFFAGGCAILLPLLLITPTADWRYLMPASVCWLMGILNAGALASEPGWSKAQG